MCAGTVRFDAIAPTMLTVGDCDVPCGRFKVTRSCQSDSERPVRATNVSIEMKPTSSPCDGTDVRCRAPPSAGSSEAQRPITYHFDDVPASVVPRISTCTQVPSGVSAFHEATSSSRSKPGWTTGEVQVAVS
jgi:hypothetical protein